MVLIKINEDIIDVLPCYNMTYGGNSEVYDGAKNYPFDSVETVLYNRDLASNFL